MTCAYAIRGALRKFSGVETVEVSLNKGLATMTLKPGNTVRIIDVWEAVRKNGFTPKQTSIVVRGEVRGGTPRPELTITGTNKVYEIAGDAKAVADLRNSGGKPVTVEGKLQAPAKESKAVTPLIVTGVRN